MNRKDNFGYEALGLMFDYFESFEDETGEEIEMDVIAICCEYSEDSLQGVINNYLEIDVVCDADNEAELIGIVTDYLNDNTTLIGVTSDNNFVYAQF
jgi:hypothetical protein